MINFSWLTKRTRQRGWASSFYPEKSGTAHSQAQILLSLQVALASISMQILAKWKIIHFPSSLSLGGGQGGRRIRTGDRMTGSVHGAITLAWHGAICSLEQRLKPLNQYLGCQPNPDLALCKWVAVDFTCCNVRLGWWSGFLRLLYCMFAMPHLDHVALLLHWCLQTSRHCPGLGLWTVSSHLIPRDE